MPQRLSCGQVVSDQAVCDACGLFCLVFWTVPMKYADVYFCDKCHIILRKYFRDGNW